MELGPGLTRIDVDVKFDPNQLGRLLRHRLREAEGETEGMEENLTTFTDVATVTRGEGEAQPHESSYATVIAGDSFIACVELNADSTTIYVVIQKVEDPTAKNEIRWQVLAVYEPDEGVYEFRFDAATASHRLVEPQPLFD